MLLEAKTAKRTFEKLTHPERLIQQDLGNIYTAALGHLRIEPQRFSVNEVLGITSYQHSGVEPNADQLLISYYEKDSRQGTVISTFLRQGELLSNNPTSVYISSVDASGSVEGHIIVTQDHGQYDMKAQLWDGSPLDRFKPTARIRLAILQKLNTRLTPDKRISRHSHLPIIDVI